MEKVWALTTEGSRRTSMVLCERRLNWTIHSMYSNSYTWLTRYPRPQYIGYDNGSEFKAQFKQMCDNYGIKEKPSTNYNLQSNGIIERVHQAIGNALQTFELENKELNTNDPWEHFLSAAAWAIRT
jgi:hypothetical protein